MELRSPTNYTYGKRAVLAILSFHLPPFRPMRDTQLHIHDLPAAKVVR